MKTVVAFYKFVELADYEKMRQWVKDHGLNNNLMGTILLAPEGINGGLSGEAHEVEAFFAGLAEDPRLADIERKYSEHEKHPFRRWLVRLKKEIVRMKIPNVSPNQTVGEYVSAQNWNDLISDPDVTVIDCRNEYEIDFGTFKNAINPRTIEFHEFPEYIEKKLPNKEAKIAMFCTGGIRCEKATAYMKQVGYENIYHLKGGILKYLEDVPEEDSLFEGSCFVFDHRIALDHKLQPVPGATRESAFGDDDWDSES